jgi:lipoprotein-anchoring transpeptidase ErfK/SrfK
MNKTSVSRYPLPRGVVLCGFFLLCIMLSSPAFAEKPQQIATTQTLRPASQSDSLRPHAMPPVQGIAGSAALPQSVPGAPVPEKKPDSVSSSPLIPDGFVTQKLKRGESLSKLCGKDSVCQVIFMRVNRVDNRHFPVGKTVLLPVDIQKAVQYAPVPEILTDSRGEREVRIYLTRQYFGAYEKGKLVFWGPISSGRKTYGTPPGKFFVNYKQRHKRSIKYDNAPMPFSINFYGGYFMHQQSLPGYPASHGCVRLLMTDAEKLFNWVRLRDAVTVVRNGA